jgi:hypothetical protein
MGDMGIRNGIRGLGLAFAILLATIALAAPAAQAAPTELFFSEYVEGTSNNKALEIYNGTGSAVSLSGYSVQLFSNGSTTGTTINLTGTVASGDVYVIAHPSAATAILAQTDQTSISMTFNGDDAITLRNGPTVVDSLGQVGLDPGTAWGVSPTSTLDNTLRRKPTVLSGDTNPSDAFDPALEWDGYGTDAFDGLGAHSVQTGYPRPRGGTPLRASLVPAYLACTSPNRSHGAPLASGSCTPPVQQSSFLTVGTPDANAQAASFIGSVLLKVKSTAPEDLTIVASLTDVRTKFGPPLSDYTGELQGRLPLRITDKYNGPSQNEPATGDTAFTFTIPCTGTTDTAIGSTCASTTTANAVLPGSVVNAMRAIWQVGQIEVLDGGPDGVASTSDNTVFARQGVFVP